MTPAKHKEWREAPLGEALTFQRGFDITKAQQQVGDYSVISSSGPNSSHSDYMVRGPGVVIGRKGTLGSVFFTPKNYWPHDTTLWVKDFHGNDAKWAYYFLKTLGLEKYDCGASNPSLNRNHIHALAVRYPSPATQCKIAAILYAYDDLIENNKRRLQILERLTQSIYREWFVHFRFPSHAKVQLVASTLGDIPRGWQLKPLGEIATITMGLSPKGDTYNEQGEGTPLINGPVEFSEMFTKRAKWTTSPTKLCGEGDLIVCVRGSTTGKYVKSDGVYCLGRGVCGLSGEHQCCSAAK